VVDIGGGNFAFFAHLKPGSLRVKLGDHVKRGQIIAQLGNTGQSDAPHLHFHVMDGTSPLDANGLPFVFTRFAVRGTLDAAAEDALSSGKAVTFAPGALNGAHRGQLPLNDQVVDFPDR
jgi:murein DD-endopeptidase MepM/ murein hydrolase activator NlpD